MEAVDVLKYVHRRVMTKQRNYNNWCIVYVSFTEVTGCGWSIASESGILDLMLRCTARCYYFMGHIDYCFFFCDDALRTSHHLFSHNGMFPWWLYQYWAVQHSAPGKVRTLNSSPAP